MVALLIIGINKLSNLIFYVEKPETPGYTVEVEQVVATSVVTSADISVVLFDIGALMAVGVFASGD